ncbi:DUF6124 family protein [Pseudomonas koreensis]|uniref:DUF3077 domain-containing protein n=1 Tax=Pseudomonas koreensis TaxID=198620 RepID=A0A9X3B2H9_9PSED|nr:hypothetical protein [Pseudomonas koreensis]MCU7248236.1 hypothetical protein [Pseudomonas koreensis]
MIKPTPNPPETDTPTEADPASPYSSLDPKKLHDAAERALDHHLKPQAPKRRKPSTMFTIDPYLDQQSLLAHACESMASANVMLSDFAALLDPPYRSTVLGIAQVVMFGELAVNRALDNFESSI